MSISAPKVFKSCPRGRVDIVRRLGSVLLPRVVLAVLCPRLLVVAKKAGKNGTIRLHKSSFDPLDKDAIPPILRAVPKRASDATYEVFGRTRTKSAIQPEESLMKFRPLADRILVKRIDSEERTKGGLIIPDTAKEKPQQAEVVAIGNGKRQDDGKVTPIDVKVGDRILFGKYSGSEIKVDGDELLILREDEVLGIIEK